MVTTATGAPSLAPTTTPLLAGFLVNCLLYGFLLNQICWYYMSFPKDSPIMKAFVGILAGLETAQTAMVFYDAWMGYAVDFGDMAAFNNIHLAWLDIPILTSIIALLVQSFFVWRIYNLSKSWITIVAVELVALFQCGAAFAAGIIIRNLHNYSEVTISHGARASVETWLAASAACNVLIALIMVFLLTRIPAYFKQTQALLSKLVIISVETGSITAVFAVVVLILFQTVGGSYYACLGALVAKLYSNVALAVLNSRITIKGGRDKFYDISATVGHGGAPGLSGYEETRASGPAVFAVNVSHPREL